jgi:hypothetical protein
MNKLTSEQKIFFEKVKELLWEVWDPIGVNDGENDWNDEYDSYAPHVFRLAIEGKDAMRIAQSLSLSISQNMGLTPNKEHDLHVAKAIVDAKTEILG